MDSHLRHINTQELFMLDVWIRDVTVHEIIPNGHGKHVMVQWMQSYKESG